MESSRPRILFVFFAPDQDQIAEFEDYFQMLYMGPLQETQQADYSIFWYGPWMCDANEDVNEQLVTQCASYKPTIVMLINGWHSDSNHHLGHVYPSLVTFYLLRKLFHVRITALWTDQKNQNFKNSDHVTRFCDIAFTHEHPDLYVDDSAFPEKYIFTPTAFSPGLFHGDPQSVRSVDVGFVGQVSGQLDGRAEGLAALTDAGIEIVRPGNRTENKLSNEAYAEFIKNAKIVVNWSRHVSGGWFQAKGRIFETTLAGSLLVCESCDPVNHWFRPNVDYVAFHTPEELVEKVKYYLSHEDERLQIAKQGHQTALENYTAEKIWAERLDLILGESLYCESEAIAGLCLNVSQREMMTARLIREKMEPYGDVYDVSCVDDVIVVLQKAHRSVLWRLRSESCLRRRIAFKIKSYRTSLKWYFSLVKEKFQDVVGLSPKNT